MPDIDKQPHRTLFGIQYLRAGASISVLVFHAFEAMTLSVRLLALGVDLFFVISGFVMVVVTGAGTRPWPFLKARIFRIVPLYWCLSLAAVALLYGRVSRSSPIPFRHLLDGTGSLPWRQVITSFLFIPAENPGAGYPMPILAAGWTLNLEMFFYALFALTLLLPRRQQLVALSASFGTLIVFGWALSLRAVPWSAWTSPIIFEFLAGAWIGRAWQRGDRLLPVTVTMALVGAGLCGLNYVATYPNIDMHSPHTGLRVITTPFFVTLLSFVLHAERRGMGIRIFRLPRLLGDASYSIYLWQFFPVIIVARYLTPGTLLYAANVIIIGVAGGLLIHQLVEQPLRRRMPAN